MTNTAFVPSLLLKYTFTLSAGAIVWTMEIWTFGLAHAHSLANSGDTGNSAMAKRAEPVSLVMGSEVMAGIWEDFSGIGC